MQHALRPAAAGQTSSAAAAAAERGLHPKSATVPALGYTPCQEAAMRRTASSRPLWIEHGELCDILPALECFGQTHPSDAGVHLRDQAALEQAPHASPTHNPAKACRNPLKLSRSAFTPSDRL